MNTQNTRHYLIDTSGIRDWPEQYVFFRVSSGRVEPFVNIPFYYMMDNSDGSMWYTVNLENDRRYFSKKNYPLTKIGSNVNIRVFDDGGVQLDDSPRIAFEKFCSAIKNPYFPVSDVGLREVPKKNL